MSLAFANRFFSFADLCNVLLIFGLGSVAGSFCCCVAMCIAKGKDGKKERSHCNSCAHVLAPRDLIPVISFLLLKGRCRYCGTKLSYQYLLSELFLGFVYVLAYFRFQKIDLNVFCLLNLFDLFLELSLVDIESYIIPNGFIVAGIINWFISPPFWLDFGHDLCKIFEALLLSGMIYLLAWMINRISEKENLGGGDVKLIFVIGLYTGFYYGVWVLLVSSLMALIYAFCTKKRRIPFGPFLSASATFALLYRGLI